MVEAPGDSGHNTSMFLKLNPRHDGWYVGLFAALFLFKLLAPTALLTLGSGDNSNWLFICSSQGYRTIALDVDSEQLPEQTPHAPCPICGLFKLYDADPAMVGHEIAIAVDASRAATIDLKVTSHFNHARYTHSPRAPPVSISA